MVSSSSDPVRSSLLAAEAIARHMRRCARLPAAGAAVVVPTFGIEAANRGLRGEEERGAVERHGCSRSST